MPADLEARLARAFRRADQAARKPTPKPPKPATFTLAAKVANRRAATIKKLRASAARYHQTALFCAAEGWDGGTVEICLRTESALLLRALDLEAYAKAAAK